MIKWSTTHRSIVMLISFFVLLIGALIYGGMERQENPSISSPVAIVKCIYPGGSPEDIEKSILKPLEDEIGEISEIKRTDSYAMDSIGIIKVKLNDMSDEKINQTWDTLKEKVEKAQAELPAEAYKADVDTDFTDPYGVLIAISSSQYQPKDIQDVGEKLKAEIEKDPGVRAVDIFGEIDKNIEISKLT